MIDVINTALSFPSVIFTTLLGFVLLFWTTVILGGADPHMLDGDGHVDLADGGDVDADGHVEADADAHGHDGDHHGSGGLLGFLNVGSVPTSMIFSSVVLFAWMTSMVLQMTAGPALAGTMPAALAATAIFGVSSALSLAATGLLTRPLRGAFKIESRHAEEEIVDCVCTILTTKVNETFGQASYQTEGAPLTLSVRCKRSNSLTKGSKAVIVGYDAATNTYEVGELEPEGDGKTHARRDADATQLSEMMRVRDALKRAGRNAVH
jgi:hypothetical protein